MFNQPKKLFTYNAKEAVDYEDRLNHDGEVKN
jgi:hypothetical protein